MFFGFLGRKYRYKSVASSTIIDWHRFRTLVKKIILTLGTERLLLPILCVPLSTLGDPDSQSTNKYSPEFKISFRFLFYFFA